MTLRPFARIGLLAILGITVACGPKEPEITPTTLEADRLLFERGSTELAEGKWIRARTYFMEIRDNYPQSTFRADARLGIGDSFLGQRSIEGYVAAQAEFEDFLALFPTNPRVDYAQFKLAMVHFEQMRGPERDQSSTRNAIREFEQLIQSYPDSQHVDDARARLRDARDRLSEAEFLVGLYYYKQKWWPGAIERFRAIVDSDPAFSGRDRVYFHLGHALQQEGEPAEALPYLERVVEEFPDADFASEAVTAISEAQEALAAEAEQAEAAISVEAATDPPPGCAPQPHESAADPL